jgi:hypothetical protein
MGNFVRVLIRPLNISFHGPAPMEFYISLSNPLHCTAQHCTALHTAHCTALQCTQEEALLKVDIRLKAVLTLI